MCIRDRYGIKEAQIFVINLPTVQGLGQFGGFDMWLQDRGGAGHEALTQARNQLLGAAAQNEALTGVRPNGLENAPQLQLHVDRVQAQSMGMSVTDIYSAIQLMLAPVYVNDFFYEGRIKPVSYTHLDVYKRQISPRCRCRTRSPWQRRDCPAKSPSKAWWWPRPMPAS